MNPLFTTLSVARYEATVLLRSWLLRIFSLLSAIIIGLLDYLFFARNEVPWMMNAMSSFIPYLNLLLLNVVQAVVAVFLASEFLKEDRKLDITEVIYPHSMTNAEYVLGKLLGVIGVFVALNLLFLGLGLTFNLFFSGQSVTPAAYLWYPLLISLPTLVFIFGLSFLLMVLLRNQAGTVILLLGYIIVTLFFIGGKYHNLFDYMAYRVPLAYSDFVGFGDLARLLVHRGMFFLLGLGFVFLTVRLLRRLPQSRLVTRLVLGLAVLSIAGGLYLGWMYIGGYAEADDIRARMEKLDAGLRERPAVSLRGCDLDLEHKGRNIEVRAVLRVVNGSPDPLESYVFSLNPGLEVSSVERAGEAVPYERDLHILTVRPSAPLEPGGQDSLTVRYRGRIDESVCYPDIVAAERDRSYRIVFYNIDKRYAFIRPDYVLLTPESLWYPRAGLSEGAAWPVVPRVDFVDFRLRVKTTAGLSAISQGETLEKGPGEFEFRPETPLTQISLAIGPYEKRSITVADSSSAGDSTAATSTEYALYFLPGHDFFSQYLSGIDSILPDLIRSSRAQYESRLGLEYPYRRLSLVETPLQFHACHRLWKTSTEAVQPELIFLPEKGATLEAVNFRSMSYFNKRASQRNGNAMPESEMQRNMLQQFVSSAFLTSSGQSRLSRAVNQGGMFSLIDYSDCSVLPLYHYYVRHLSSSRWPLINMALEACLGGRSASEEDVMASVRMRGLIGMSSEDRANLALTKRPLAEIQAKPAFGEDVQGILKYKCDYLFNFIQAKVGQKEFKAFLAEYFRTRKFTDIGAADFMAGLSERCGEDLAPYVDAWMHENRLPAYTFSGANQYEILDGNRTRYQILVSVTNDSDIDGLVGLNFLWSKGGNFERVWGGRPQNPADERFYVVKAGQSKEIGIVLDQEIHALWVDCGLSQNLPSSKVMYFSGGKAEKGTVPFEGERVLAEASVLEDPGVVIVDDEDPGFEVQEVIKESFLRRLLHRADSTRQDYIGLLQYQVPANWTKVIYGEFYGRHKHSGHFIKAGSGENKVCWKTELSRRGRYELSCHTFDLPSQRFWNPGGGNKARVQDFHFTVYEEDGAKELSLDFNGAGEGWYSLGTFYFSEGEAKLELSDQSKGELVYADAVRWALRE